jgi:PAS domain S-box-containing protein
VRQRKDGHPIDVSLTISPIRDAVGRITGASKIIRDITERKRAEAALAEERQWLTVTLRSIGDAVIASDAAGFVKFLNPVAERMTGWPSQEALGQPLTNVFNIVNERTRVLAQNPVERVLREGIVVGLANHTALLSRDGREMSIEDSAAPIKDEKGTMFGAVMVFHDVTERRHGEAALRAARDAAEAANRAKDEFLAALSHELRTPLTPVLMLAAEMEHAEGVPTEIRSDFATIRKNIELEARLIDDLLDHTRITQQTDSSLRQCRRPPARKACLGDPSERNTSQGIGSKFRPRG